MTIADNVMRFMYFSQWYDDSFSVICFPCAKMKFELIQREKKFRKGKSRQQANKSKRRAKFVEQNEI